MKPCGFIWRASQDAPVAAGAGDATAGAATAMPVDDVASANSTGRTTRTSLRNVFSLRPSQGLDGRERCPVRTKRSSSRAVVSCTAGQAIWLILTTDA